MNSIRIAFLQLLFIHLLCHPTEGNAQSIYNNESLVIGIKDSIFSKALNETRILNLYKTPSLETNDTLSYQVIYLLDGSINEDFVHIAGLIQFFDMMGMIEPTLLVGIANVDRKRDFTFPTEIAKDKADFPTTGHSENFISFLGKELIPFIEKKHKVNSKRILIGQSLGGLLGTEILLKYPQTFSHYILVSPSLWWNNQSLLKTNMADAKISHVHIAVGKEGKTMETTARQLYNKVRKESKDTNTSFDYLKNENHASILHLAVYNALKKIKIIKGE